MYFLSGIFSFEREKFWFVHEKTKQTELVFAHTGVLKATFICSANHWIIAISNSIISHHALSNTNDNIAITVIIKSSSSSTLCILL